MTGQPIPPNVPPWEIRVLINNKALLRKHKETNGFSWALFLKALFFLGEGTLGGGGGRLEGFHSTRPQMKDNQSGSRLYQAACTKCLYSHIFHIDTTKINSTNYQVYTTNNILLNKSWKIFKIPWFPKKTISKISKDPYFNSWKKKSWINEENILQLVHFVSWSCCEANDLRTLGRAQVHHTGKGRCVRVSWGWKKWLSSRVILWIDM